MNPIVQTTQVALRAYRKGSALIEMRAEVCADEPVFKGTRVSLAQVVGLRQDFRVRRVGLTYCRFLAIYECLIVLKMREVLAARGYGAGPD